MKHVRPRPRDPPPAVTAMTLSAFRKLPTPALLQHLEMLLSRDRSNLAELLVCMGEIESRGAFKAAGYSSMHAYCVEVFRMSDDEAFKRIRAARTARRLPAILAAVADGRLHLTAITLLAKFLTRANVAELIEEATHKTKLQVQLMIAKRFPQPDVPACLFVARATVAVALPEVDGIFTENLRSVASPIDVSTLKESQVPEPVGVLANAQCVVLPVQRFPVLAPLSPSRFELRCTISQEAYDALKFAQELLGHVLPKAEVSQVLEKALLELVARLEKQKGALVEHPREQKGEARGRYVPAQVRREVWKRDGAQCTFVGDQGHRCTSKSRLEFDHTRPVACGGKSTAGNLRLRCRVHNQYEAEHLFGVGFMVAKREQARAKPGHPHAVALHATAD